MINRYIGLLAFAAATGFAGLPSALAQTPAAGRYICDNWTGRHSEDPKVQWSQVGKTAAVMLYVDAQDKARVWFPNGAFPRGVYPDAETEQTGMTLRTPERLVYQAASKTMIDTITFEGLGQTAINAVWQRFRFDAAGPKSIAFQGTCRRSRAWLTSSPPSAR